MGGLLRVATAGSVDDGKSTLVGRLLLDAKAVLADQWDAVERASRRQGYDDADLALLVDGLRAEREQGITIDVAYRYLSTPRCSFVLADTPGHVQYTRNTVTGMSTADVAVVLVDARSGLVEQTRRHATVAGLLGVGHVALAVNKMDLVGFAEEVYDAVSADFAGLAAARGIGSWSAVPVCAVDGDNLVEKSGRMPWYAGPALLPLLESLPAVAPAADGVGVRLPVQLVVRPRSRAHPDYRGYAGRIAAGVLHTGDEVVVLPSGRTSTVAGIDTPDGELAEAAAGRSVVVRLADDLDVARGDVIAAPGTAPEVTREVTATTCWLAEEPLGPGSRWRVRQATRDVPGGVVAIGDRLDPSTGHMEAADRLDLNDLGTVALRTDEPLVTDPYARARHTGSLLLVDPVTGGTAGAAVVLDPARLLGG
jgi:sulfate adenylyltransferase subunit 1